MMCLLSGRGGGACRPGLSELVIAFVRGNVTDYGQANDVHLLVKGEGGKGFTCQLTVKSNIECV